MRLWNFSAGLLALLMVACGGGESGSGESQEKGTVQLPLTSSTSDGTVYRLVGATFSFVGPQSVTVTDTDDDTVETALLAGTYTVELGGQWHLERDDAPGVTVPAQLLSPNPLPFTVSKGSTTQVRFQFKTPGQGTAAVGINVDSGGWIAGTIAVDHFDGPPGGPLEALMGKNVPFLISFPSSVVTREAQYGELTVQVNPGLTSVQFGGAHSVLLERAAASMNGAPLYFRLTSNSDGTLRFDGLAMFGQGGGFDLELFPVSSFPGPVDAEGDAAVGPFQFDTIGSLRSNSGAGRVSGPTSVNGSP